MGELPRRRWFRFRIRTLLLLTLLTVIGLSVYSYWSDYRDEALRRSRELLSPPPGSACTIILRADSLGRSDMSPSAYHTSSGGSNAVYGTLVMSNDQWIVLAAEQDRPQRWIPRENVLMIEIAGP